MMDPLAPWIGPLEDARKAVQRPAAEAVAAIVRAVPERRAEIAALLTSPAPRLRWGAAYALSLLDAAPLDALPVLAEALGWSDGDVRWASARILVRMGAAHGQVRSELRDLVRATSPLQRKMALYCLRDLRADEPGVAAAAAAALGDPDAAVRLAAVAAMAAVERPGEAAADAIAGMLDDTDAGVARAAAATLGRLGVATQHVRRTLERAADSPDAALARAARASLSLLGSGGAGRRS